jgi:hypothetical protein
VHAPRPNETQACPAGLDAAQPLEHRDRRGEAWVWGVGTWLVLRVVTTAAAWASSVWMRAGTVLPVPDYTPPALVGVAGRLAGVWLRADALWYLRVATFGYGPTTGPGVGSYAFLPLFPRAVRMLRPLFGGNEVYAALFVTNAACVLGLVLLYRFVSDLIDDDTARVAVVGLGLLPTAFFLVAPYGEPVLLASGAGALLAAQRGRYGLAALAAALAALSRPFGVLLVLPLAGMAWGREHRAWIAPAGSAMGVLIWVALVGTSTNDPLGALHVQAMWQRTFTAPWTTVAHAIPAWWSYRATEYGPYFLLDILAVAFALALAGATVVILRRRKVPAPVAAGLLGYGALAILAPLSTPFPGRPLLSFPRFVLALFPLFVGLAVIPKRLRLPLAALSTGGLAWATAVYVAARPLF